MIVSLPSRSELLIWISQLTNKTVERLELLSDGIQFCEVFEKIYPNIVNLHKLKRDAKVPLEKEKNFRILLNAISQTGLCLTINIADLSQGKITAILELLQWFYKQYKNPIDKFTKFDQIRDQRFNEPRMIKSYVGNLIVRQKSCIKTNENAENHFGASRRSLDSRLLQNAFKSEESKSIKSKIIRPSQNKEKPESKAKTSRIKSVTIKQEVFEEKCKEKKESLKKMLQEKKSRKNEQISEESLKEILDRTLNYDKPKLQRSLIKVTEAALENNPELEAKLKMLLGSSAKKEQKRESRYDSSLSPDAQVKNLLSSYMNTSERCQNDTNQSLELEKNESVFSGLNENSKMKNQDVENPIQIMISAGKKQNEQDKKQTVKKSATKTEREKGNNNMLMSQQMIKQISAQKERNQRDLNLLQKQEQNKQDNQIIATRLRVSNIFNPHEKVSNPETYCTEKKIEARQEQEKEGNVREVQSEKLHSREDDNVWKSQQKFGSYSHFP